MSLSDTEFLRKVATDNIIKESIAYRIFEIADRLEVIDKQKDRKCEHCGERDAFEPYTVKKEVWALSGLSPKGGLLHLACLELKIGRPITVDDLDPGAAWNRPLIYFFGRK
jgi:hypothetical protein